MSVEKPDDRATWIRHSFTLALLAAAFHFLQCIASAALWNSTRSAALAAFGLDAAVSSSAALRLALGIRRSFEMLADNWRSRVVGYAYLAAAAMALYAGAVQLWEGRRPAPTILGIALAAVSMLVIPIIGSYMKTLAVELRNQPLKAAAVFTFGNSYLSMVLLIALLTNAGMDLGWGDPVGALVMFPFMAQKGIQILIEEGRRDYVED